MNDFLKEALRIKEEVISIRRDLHKHPEIDFDLKRTNKVVGDFLNKEKIPYYTLGKAGICGVIRGEKTGNNKVIGLRADMDALPIIDKKQCEYKSQVYGKMHACGHDGHTSILLGAAKILNSHKSEFSGEVRLIFEPAEETTGGAPLMIEEGVLKNPNVDMIVGLHVNEDVECGKISIKRGVTHASSNPFNIKITGVGGHGAHPDGTIDPILVACTIVNSIQSIVSRNISPFSPAVVTVGSIHGGSAPNIIPEEVILTGIIRTMTNDEREFVKKRITSIVENICESFEAKAEINIDEGYPCLYNNDDIVDRVIYSAEKIVGSENIVKSQFPSMGVESFSYFAREIPAAFYFLGTKNTSKKCDKPAHGSYFDIDEDALPIGVALQCDIAFHYLTSN